MDKIKYILSRVKRFLIHILMYALRVFPIDNKKVVIVSYYGGGFGDNGKGIALKLKEYDPEIKIVWAVTKNNKNKLPDFLSSVEYRSLKYYYEMATAKVWVDNARKGADVIKRKNQFYMQAWHGMVALKQIEKDAEKSLSRSYIDDAKNDSKMADVILSGCGFFTELVKRAFWYNGEILKCGSPRLDVLFNITEETKREVKNKLNIPENKKVILYAPTFRANGNLDCYIKDYEGILSALKKEKGESYVFLVRLHPNIADKSGFINYNENVINATVYPDLYDIISISDIVISDYSSLMFDSALINKKVFLYASDIEDYKGDRGFYFELEQLPFPLAEKEKELTENMLTLNESEYYKNLEKFNLSVDYYEDGTASESAAKRIIEELKK